MTTTVSRSNSNTPAMPAMPNDGSSGMGSVDDMETALEVLQDQFDGKSSTRSAEKLLQDLGFHPGTVDKHYSANTESAVKKFQSAAGLHATGALDTRTLGAMRKAAAEKKAGTEGAGQASAGVKRTEERLHKLGYNTGKVDGVYDQKTAAAARAFKHDEGIKNKSAVSRGLLGKGTQQKLKARSSSMKQSEKELQALGFHPGTADGKYNKSTQKAVDAFRRKHHQKGVGKHATAGTLRSIRKAYQAHQAASTKTVKGCAQFLLHSKNVSFWSGLSSGSDRKNVERLAKGEKAFVPATGQFVKPDLKMMQALVDMAKHGRIQINALTGGQHVANSNHYRGHAVDLDLAVGNSAQIERIANRYGGTRNFETSHIHLDF
ncbi:MAG TPA: peptidoglycan-binding domain-containing protein [Myxococcota bacterium]